MGSVVSRLQLWCHTCCVEIYHILAELLGDRNSELFRVLLDDIYVFNGTLYLPVVEQTRLRVRIWGL